MRLARQVGLPARIELAALGLAVRSRAVGAELGGIERDPVAGRAGAELGAELPQAMAAGRGAEGGGRHGRVGLGEDLHHAAGSVAIELGQRPAQDLDPSGRAERDVRRLALAVGHGRGDAVDDEPHAADTKGRARAEAADRELQILRIVLPVEHADARHAVQRFRQVDLRAGALDRLARHRADGGRRVEARLSAALHADDDRVELYRQGVLGLRVQGGGRGERDRGEDEAHEEARERVARRSRGGAAVERPQVQGTGLTSICSDSYQAARSAISASVSGLAIKLITSWLRLPPR